MFCSHCGKDISENAVACPNCGEPIKKVASHKNGRALEISALFLFVVSFILLLVSACIQWFVNAIGGYWILIAGVCTTFIGLVLIVIDLIKRKKSK